MKKIFYEMGTYAGPSKKILLSTEDKIKNKKHLNDLINKLKIKFPSKIPFMVLLSPENSKPIPQENVEFFEEEKTFFTNKMILILLIIGGILLYMYQHRKKNI